MLGRLLALVAALALLAPPALPAASIGAAPSLLALAICTGEGIRIVRVPAGQGPPAELPAGQGEKHQHCLLCLTATHAKPLLPAQGGALRTRRTPRWRPLARRRERPRRVRFLLPPPRAPPWSPRATRHQ